MTREEFEKFVAGDERIAAVINGGRKRPEAYKAAVLWSRGQTGDVTPEKWNEDESWALPARNDCMPIRLDRWLTGKR